MIPGSCPWRLPGGGWQGWEWRFFSGPSSVFSWWIVPSRSSAWRPSSPVGPSPATQTFMAWLNRLATPGGVERGHPSPRPPGGRPRDVRRTGPGYRGIPGARVRSPRPAGHAQRGGTGVTRVWVPGGHRQGSPGGLGRGDQHDPGDPSCLGHGAGAGGSHHLLRPGLHRHRTPGNAKRSPGHRCPLHGLAGRGPPPPIRTWCSGRWRTGYP